MILTSVDCDGTGDGFDYKLCEEVSKICSVPLILSGGLGKIDHIKRLFKKIKIDAIATAKAIHYNELTISKIKKQLS